MPPPPLSAFATGRAAVAGLEVRYTQAQIVMLSLAAILKLVLLAIETVCREVAATEMALPMIPVVFPGVPEFKFKSFFAVFRELVGAESTRVPEDSSSFQ